MYFAGPITLGDSTVLAILQSFAGAIVILPVIIGGYLFRRSYSSISRNIFAYSVIAFLLNLALFGVLSGFATRFTRDNLIDRNSEVSHLMFLTVIISSLGILLGTSLLIVDLIKSKRAKRKAKT